MPFYYKRTRFASAYAGSNAVANVAFNPGATGDANWADNYGELGDHVSVDYQVGASGQGADTNVLTTITFPLNYEHTFHLEALNSTWTNDLADMSLEFLNASNAVVAALRTTTTNNYGNYLQYGASLAGLSNAGGAGYRQTNGDLTFSSTQMVYTKLNSSNYNDSFAFNCAANTITQVRVSGVRAKSTYTGSGSAYVLFQRYMASNILGQLAGVVNESGSPAQRTVRAYNRLTGALLKEVTSNPTTGAFSIDAGSEGPFYVVVLDDAAGTQYNAQVIDLLTPI